MSNGKSAGEIRNKKYQDNIDVLKEIGRAVAKEGREIEKTALANECTPSLPKCECTIRNDSCKNYQKPEIGSRCVTCGHSTRA